MLLVLVIFSIIGANISCAATEKVLKNKVVIVTGAAQGIGYGIAENFLKEEVRFVIILDINYKKGIEAAATLNSKYGDGKAVFIECDVTTDLEVSDYIIDTYKYVDVMVNNAGILNEYNPRKMLTTNAIAMIEWSLKFWRHMSIKGGGHGGTIINIDSIYGYTIDPFLVSYKAAKYAVLGFTKSLGHEYNYGISRVRVVALCPGYTETAMARMAMAWDEQRAAVVNLFENAPRQSADDVGRAAVKVFHTADSGSAWDVIGGEPPSEAPVSMTFPLSVIVEASIM